MLKLRRKEDKMSQEMDEIVSDVRFPDEVILAMVKEDPNLSREEAKRYIDGLNNVTKEGVIFLEIIVCYILIYMVEELFSV